MSIQAEVTRRNQELQRVKITFAVIYFLFMAARAIFGPFITIYLQEKGLSAELIGRITGINSLVIILSQPFWGIIADKLRSMKKTLIFCIVAQALFALSLIAASNFMVISVAFCIYTTFSSAEGPLMDTWSLKSIKAAGDGNAVGQLKLWGCIGFSACSVLAGLFIKDHSASEIIPIFSIVLLCSGLALGFIHTNDTPQKAVLLRDLQLGRIFQHKEFLVFLLFIFTMQLAHRGSYTFYPLLVRQLGGDSSVVGYASALMFVSEAVIMLLLKKMLGRFRPHVLVMASAFAFMLWHLLLMTATSPWQVMASCLMDGPSFALFTMGTLYYLDEIAPKELRTTYQTIAYSVYFGLSGIVGNVGGGWIIDHLGYRTMYGIGILITLASVVLFFVYTKISRNRNTSAGSAES